MNRWAIQSLSSLLSTLQLRSEWRTMDEAANVLIVPCKVVTVVCRWPTVVCKFNVNALNSSMGHIAPEFCWHSPEIKRTLLGGELCKYRIKCLPSGEASGCVISPGQHCWVLVVGHQYGNRNVVGRKVLVTVFGYVLAWSNWVSNVLVRPIPDLPWQNSGAQMASEKKPKDVTVASPGFLGQILIFWMIVQPNGKNV